MKQKMKTIKIIDLFIKIANDDSFRPNIKFRGSTYTYEREFGDYRNDGNNKWGLLGGHCINMILNDEVEIIEEDKKIEKLELSRSDGNITIISEENAKIQNKINEIIDRLEELEKGE